MPYQYFHMKVQIQQNNVLSLMDSIIAMKKQEMEISRKNSSDRNTNNRLQKIVRDDEGFAAEKSQEK